MGLALMEGVERINAVVVRDIGQGQEQGAGVPPRQNPYAIEMDQERNCYGRGKAMKRRRVEYGGGMFKGNIEQIGNLKEVENLEALN